MKLKKICDYLESIISLNEALEFDNCGLNVGKINNDIKKIMVCLNPDEKAINKAIENKIDLIICHHPLIFKPLKMINDNTVSNKPSLVIKCIENNLAVYAMHTNLDKLKMNDWATNLLVNENEIFGHEKIARLINYTNASDIKTCLEDIKKAFKLDKVIYGGNLNRKINKIVIQLGNGNDLLNEIVENNIDLYITGDVSYSNMMHAIEYGYILVDIGHHSEIIMVDKVKELLENKFNELEIICYYNENYLHIV